MIRKARRKTSARPSRRFRFRRHCLEGRAAKTQVRCSFTPVVKKVAPGVVNLYASRVETMAHNPLFDDPIFRRFLGGGGTEDQRNDLIPKRLFHQGVAVLGHTRIDGRACLRRLC